MVSRLQSTSNDSKRFAVYPWTDLTKTSPTDQERLQAILSKLNAFGSLTRIGINPSDRLHALTDKIMRRLFVPGPRNVKDIDPETKAPKILLCGKDRAFLAMLLKSVLVTYALTYGKVVHPIDAGTFEQWVSAGMPDDDFMVIPHGTDMLMGSPLIGFFGFCTNSGRMREWELHHVSLLFGKWMRPWVNWIGTYIYTGPWGSLMRGELLKKARHQYDEHGAVLAETAEYWKIGDDTTEMEPVFVDAEADL